MSFFTIQEVQIIGNIALGSLGFFVPYTAWQAIKLYREERDIKLDKQWAEHEKRTGEKEPASNRARMTPYVPKRSQQPAQRTAAPRKPVAAPSKAQTPKPAPKPVETPRKPVGDKPWDSWSPHL